MMMRMAEVAALRSTCERLNVGAIISREGRVLSTGYNGNIAGQAHCNHIVDGPCTTAVHAEANAIVWAARMGVATEGTELFTTHQPCLDCAKLIVNAGIYRVYFQNLYRLRDGLELLLRVDLLEVFVVREDYSLYQVTR